MNRFYRRLSKYKDYHGKLSDRRKDTRTRSDPVAMPCKTSNKSTQKRYSRWGKSSAGYRSPSGNRSIRSSNRSMVTSNKLIHSILCLTWAKRKWTSWSRSLRVGGKRCRGWKRQSRRKRRNMPTKYPTWWSNAERAGPTLGRAGRSCLWKKSGSF